MIELTPRKTITIPVEYTHIRNKHVPICVKDRSILFVYDDRTIGLLRSNSDGFTTELLVDHNKPITAMCVSPGDVRFLCSCCMSMVIVSDIGPVFVENYATNIKPEGFIVGVDLGHVELCVFSWDRKWLALVQERHILIILLQVQANDKGVEVLDSVEEHATLPLRQSTSLACFSPIDPNFLVVAEDNTFTVWNVETQTLIHQSLCFGMHTLTFCSFSGENAKLVLGTSKGKVKIVNVAELESLPPWNIMSVDVPKSLAEMDKTCNNDIDFVDGNGESGCIVFSAKLYANLTKIERPDPNDEPDLFDRGQYNNTLRSILAPGTLLIIFSSRGITIFDCKSTDCLAHLQLSELIPGQSLSLIAFALLAGESLNKLTCLVKSSERGATIQIVSLQCRAIEQNMSASSITVIPNAPVKAKSLLRREMKLSSEKSLYASKESLWSKRQKSSCYGAKLQHQMFVPQINFPNKSSTSNPKNKSSNGTLSVQLVDTSVIENCGPPKQSVQEVCVEQGGSTIHLTASGDGNSLACSSSSAICVVPFKNFDLGKSTNLIGHDGAINTLHFNLDSKWLISSSKDSTARVWDLKNKKCVLNIEKKTTAVGTKNQLQKQTGGGNPDIVDARFYYMDKFILLASGNALEMYCHLLNDPEAKADSFGRLRSKKVHTAQVPSQNVTCFSAANQLHSYIVLCGCSDRAVRVYDVNAESFCVELADVHSRPPHRVRQITGSACSAEMHDLFLTAALGDCVRLWDLRSVRCVQKYARHVTRSYAAGVDVSPCARYVAVGSEDKAVYIYDTRRPEDYLGKLLVRGDIVVDVAFNPTQPLLAASSLNGYLTRFSA